MHKDDYKVNSYSISSNKNKADTILHGSLRVKKLLFYFPCDQ